MIEAYIDDAWTHGQTPIVAHGGVFGNRRQFLELEQRWRRLLERPNECRGPIARIHASPLRAQRGEFAGWSENEAAKLMSDAIDIIVDCGIYGEVLTVDKVAHDKYFPGTYSKTYGSAEYVSIVGILECILHRAQECSDEEVRFTFDSRNVDNVSRAYAEVKSCATSAGWSLGGIEFGDNTATPALQAADVVVWEACNAALRHNGIPVSGAFQRLLETGRVNSMIMDRGGVAARARSIGLIDPIVISSATPVEPAIDELRRRLEAFDIQRMKPFENRAMRKRRERQERAAKLKTANLSRRGKQGN